MKFVSFSHRSTTHLRVFRVLVESIDVLVAVGRSHRPPSSILEKHGVGKMGKCTFGSFDPDMIDGKYRKLDMKCIQNSCKSLIHTLLSCNSVLLFFVSFVTSLVSFVLGHFLRILISNLSLLRLRHFLRILTPNLHLHHLLPQSLPPQYHELLL